MISSITLVAIAAAGSNDKEFRPGPASDYAHQSAERVTVGAKPYNTEDLTAEAFGKKTDLLRYGVLPVLVVIENKRDKAIDLRDLEVSLVATDGRHASAVNPEDIPFLAKHGRKPPPVQTPIPLPKRGNPLNAPSIVMRAFSAKMLPPGDSANGFFYFEARSEPGDKLYLNGMRDARSGQDILYFEFPLEP
ncbi:MAG TPA: hypothetical protein VHU83_17395 [Bryobacteraceae bacterium]|nr:hypothetical protein [Bryobacteraceae bacterium]